MIGWCNVINRYETLMDPFDTWVVTDTRMWNYSKNEIDCLPMLLMLYKKMVG